MNLYSIFLDLLVNLIANSFFLIKKKSKKKIILNRLCKFNKKIKLYKVRIQM